MLTSPSLPPEWYPAVAAAFALDDTPPEAITEGQVNEHWHVRRGAAAYVLRRYAAGQTTPSIAWEHALIGFMHSRGWPVAPALAAEDGDLTVDGDGGPFALFPLLPGRPGEYVSEPGRTVKGRLLARFHADAARFPSAQRPGLGRAWELDALAARAGGNTFNELLAAFSREHPPLGRAVRGARYRNLRELAKLGYGDLPDTVVHCDFHTSNLFFEGAMLTGLLDFDWAHRDAAAYDIASSISIDCLSAPDFDVVSPAATEAFVRGYAGLRRLTDAEVALIPSLVRSAILTFVTFRLVQWSAGGSAAVRATESIARTVFRRFPPLDSGEAELAAAIARGNANR
jgi:homoserine kinase type II